MGLQSFSYYVAVSWFPSVLQDVGYTPAPPDGSSLGFRSSRSQRRSPMPSLIRRAPDQRLLAVVAPLLLVVAIVGLIAAPSAASFWVVLMGLGNGPTMILALTFFALRTSDHRQAAALSLMAQSIGYFIAALGPIAFGLLHDMSHGWTVPLIALAASLIVQSLAGYGAGRNMQMGTRR